MIDYLMEKLGLKKSRKENIENFSEAYRLKPYVKILAENPDFYDELRKIYPDKIKDNWDCVVELYRYNIKLSKAIYPYLAILENVLKIKLSNYLKEKYGENFYYNNELIFISLKFDDFDKKIIKEYFNHKINKFVREELIAKYKENDLTLAIDKIKTKISKIKKALSVLTDAEEYRFQNKDHSLNGFIETKPTLNYWITLLEIENLYKLDDNKYELKNIFPKAEQEDLRTLKTIARKLDDIRILRNYVSHYSKIVYANITSNFTVWDIYKNTIELFKLLGCEDVNYIIGDINCCTHSSFEGLYNELAFIHKRFIDKKMLAQEPARL